MRWHIAKNLVSSPGFLSRYKGSPTVPDCLQSASAAAPSKRVGDNKFFSHAIIL